LIVGDIQDVGNYAAVGGWEALAPGTTFCNLGTAQIQWVATTNQHPVIAFHLYRLRVVDGSSRFEEIGISWARHGFFALSGTVCCTTCTPAGSGAALGAGCSSPNTAGINGSQQILGPRHPIDPHTGLFPYPPPHPSGGNTGRIEVDVADLEPSSPSGTRYFVECLAIASDDAAAGNQDNGASFREVSVTGSGDVWNFAGLGTTQREVPAIEAWRLADPSVTLRNVRVPNEGLLVLGFAATPLGGGQYHYEYALWNANSHVGVGSFAIAIPAGVQITNVGFHDVSYRGGDGVGGVDQDGTDWPAALQGGILRWATQTAAQDPNANALRWGTAYNFRFDADSPPTSGTIVLGTFENGGTLSTLADVPAGLPPGTPFCAGDGSMSTPCPCSNVGATGRGCANSQNANGAILTSSGDVNLDDVVLVSSGELPSSLTLFLQGDVTNPSGIPFGDGVRCVAGLLKRLYVKSASSTVAVAPQAGDPSITTRSAALGDPIAPGSTRFYQAYYRDPQPGFCPDPPGSTFNASSGQIIVW
jgi:hypothetical protein